MYNTFRTLIDRLSISPEKEEEWILDKFATHRWMNGITYFISGIDTEGASSEKILISLAWALIQSQISRDRWWPLESISLPFLPPCESSLFIIYSIALCIPLLGPVSQSPDRPQMEIVSPSSGALWWIFPWLNDELPVCLVAWWCVWSGLFI